MRFVRKIRKEYVLSVIAAIAILASLTIYAHAISGIKITLKVYTTNPFGWELTHVKTTANAVFADPCNFDTQTSYTSHEAHSSWWCFTCFAKAKALRKVVSQSAVGEDTWWEQGSWNRKIKGVNHVWIYPACYVGPYYTHEKVYYDVNSDTMTVIDAIKNAIEFITQYFPVHV